MPGSTTQDVELATRVHKQSMSDEFVNHEQSLISSSWSPPARSERPPPQGRRRSMLAEMSRDLEKTEIAGNRGSNVVVATYTAARIAANLFCLRRVCVGF